MAYATSTDVPVEKSRAEIESCLTKYGATKFAYMMDLNQAIIGFVANGKMVRFNLPLPRRDEEEFRFTLIRKNQRTEAEAYKAWEQACRSKWRSLLLCVKSKLEAVECGITTFEQEFLAHIVLPNGQTFGEHAIPQINEMSTSARMPVLTLNFNNHPETPALGGEKGGR